MFKDITINTVIALLVTSGMNYANAADWRFVDENNRGDKKYLDVESARFEGNLSYVWFLTNKAKQAYSPTGKNYYSSTLTLEAINCSQQVISSNKIIGYSLPNGNGEVIFANNDKISFPIAPGTTSWNQFTAVCKSKY